MVKDETATQQKQREAIDSALRRLGLRPDQEGFARRGEEVSLKGRTLYRAWLGTTSGSPAVPWWLCPRPDRLEPKRG